MLVSELKKELEKYDNKELKSIIVELYKRIPKNKKEDYNIDEFIKNIETTKTTSKKEITYEELKKEIIYFLSLVDNEYYAIPNKIVPKKERSSWRFKVKRYYKELNKILPNFKDGNDATLLLIELFKRLSIGSNILLFTNWETFKAVGISQSNYYDTIIKRILYNGYTKDNLKKCIDLLDIKKDPYELYYDMFESYIYNLKTIDNRETSIELMSEKVISLKNKIKNIKNNNQRYYIITDINNYVECISELYFILNEFELGKKYFHNNYIESDKEIIEYILLEKLEELNLYNEWIKEYETNKNTIDFRDSIKEKYNSLKKDNK